MNTRTICAVLAVVSTLVCLVSPAAALPTQVDHINTPQCDFLFIPKNLHELGDINEFPLDESLASADLGQAPVAPCPLLDIPTIPEALVEIRNTSGRVWLEVWYVADPETNITNFDGEANAFGLAPVREAFRIDRKVSDPLGMHHPLVFESMTQDGIWEVGESWRFILQDYTNSLNLPASAITSVGVGDASSTPASGIIDSSGSIIGVTVPEPGALVLAAIGLALPLHRRRSAC